MIFPNYQESFYNTMILNYIKNKSGKHNTVNIKHVNSSHQMPGRLADNAQSIKKAHIVR